VRCGEVDEKSAGGEEGEQQPLLPERPQSDEQQPRRIGRKPE
jgi:hypothetical protein